MRYTEKDYDFKFDSPQDFIRVIFCTTFLAPFRFFNEISKKVLFLGKRKVSELVNTGFLIGSLLAVGEVGYQLIFKKALSIFTGTLPLFSILIALGLLFGLKVFVNSIELDDMDIFEEVAVPQAKEIVEEPMPSIVSEIQEEVTVKEAEGEPTPITEEFMAEPLTMNNTAPEISSELQARLSGYDRIMEDDYEDDGPIDMDTILEEMANPINEEELSQDYEDQTRAILGDKFDEKNEELNMLLAEMEESLGDFPLPSVGMEFVDDYQGATFDNEYSYNEYIL